MRSKHRLSGGSYWSDDDDDGAGSNAKTRRSSRYGDRPRTYDASIMNESTDLPF